MIRRVKVWDVDLPAAFLGMLANTAGATAPGHTKGTTMSKENVALFSRAITKNANLNQRILEAEPTTDAWIEIARDAGFDFTADEFAAVVGETLGRTITPQNAVREYLGAQHDVGDVELSERALDAVVGGRTVSGSLIRRKTGWMMTNT
jgi:hypothetical protein